MVLLRVVTLAGSPAAYLVFRICARVVLTLLLRLSAMLFVYCMGKVLQLIAEPGVDTFGRVTVRMTAVIPEICSHTSQAHLRPTHVCILAVTCPAPLSTGGSAI